VRELRVAIAGGSGRMGQALTRLIAADPGFTLVGATTTPDDPLLGQDAGTVAGVAATGVALSTELASDCDVLIEFTLPAGCAAWCAWAAAHKIPIVSGTTGLDTSQADVLGSAARQVPLVWAPNMSVGINLLLALVEDAARALDASWDIEIAEAHHRRKVDAPSGTARALLEAACRPRGSSPDDTARHGRAGTPGPRTPDEIGVHALRLGGLVGEHAVHFASETEVLTLQHRALSRTTFAEGALRAARWLVEKPPGQYDMRDVLFH
jgi:4-hydroxy-tetrahydrodipicolinate reductase